MNRIVLGVGTKLLGRAPEIGPRKGYGGPVVKGHFGVSQCPSRVNGLVSLPQAEIGWLLRPDICHAKRDLARVAPAPI